MSNQQWVTPKLSEGVFISHFTTMLWVYVRHELMLVSWAVSDASLLSALLVGVAPWSRYWSLLTLVGLLAVIILIPFNIARVLNLKGVLPVRQQLVMMIGLLPVLFLVVGQTVFHAGTIWDTSWFAEFYRDLAQTSNPFWLRTVIVVLLTTVCWAEGMSYVGREIDIDQLGLRFRVGALIIAPLLIALAGRLEAYRIAPLLLLYFLASLIAVVLTRAEAISKEQSGKNYPMSLRWVGLTTGVSLGIVLSAGIFAALTGTNSIQFLQIWLGPFWQGIVYAGTTAIATLTHISQPILTAFDWLLNSLITFIRFLQNLATPIPPSETDPSTSTIPSTLELLLELFDNLKTPFNFTFNLRLIALIFFILLIFFITFSLSTHLLKRNLNSENDSSVAPKNDPDQPISTLRRVWEQLAGIRRQQIAASIRRIYQEMSDIAASLGYPRLESETPYEYIPSLARVWSEGNEQITLITESYIRVRYGQIPETKAELAQIKAAWQHLQSTLPQQNNTAAHHPK